VERIAGSVLVFAWRRAKREPLRILFELTIRIAVQASVLGPTLKESNDK
jgi:hypothetical protein